MNPGIHYKFTSQQLPPLAISLALFFTMYSFAVSQFEGHTSPLFFHVLGCNAASHFPQYAVVAFV